MPPAIPSPASARSILRSADGDPPPANTRRTRTASMAPDSSKYALRKVSTPPGVRASSSAKVSSPKECAAPPIGRTESAKCSKRKSAIPPWASRSIVYKTAVPTSNPSPRTASTNSVVQVRLRHTVRYAIAMIWFNISHTLSNMSTGTCFQAWGFAARDLQSKDFGW